MLYFYMQKLNEKILGLQREGKALFYNTSGSKLAYQLGVKHISSAEFLGFAHRLPNGDLRIRKDFILVNFEKKEIIKILQGSSLTPLSLESY